MLKDMVIAGVEVKRGEVLDKSLLPIHKIKRLFESRKITPDYSLYDRDDIVTPAVETPKETVIVEETPLTNDENHDIVMPEIKAAGPAWFKVWLGEEQIGKTVRTKLEAEEIVAEWLANQNK